jgi:hypothetical protein
VRDLANTPKPTLAHKFKMTSQQDSTLLAHIIEDENQFDRNTYISLNDK